MASAIGSGRRITACASRYQPPRLVRRGLTASFEPQSANVAGAMTSDARPAMSATTAPAIPIDFRNPSGKTVSVISASATVTALKATVRPAVRIVVRTASGFSFASSSR